MIRLRLPWRPLPSFGCGTEGKAPVPACVTASPGGGRGGEKGAADTGADMMSKEWIMSTLTLLL